MKLWSRETFEFDTLNFHTNFVVKRSFQNFVLRIVRKLTKMFAKIISFSLHFLATLHSDPNGQPSSNRLIRLFINHTNSYPFLGTVFIKRNQDFNYGKS